MDKNRIKGTNEVLKGYRPLGALTKSPLFVGVTGLPELPVHIYEFKFSSRGKYQASHFCEAATDAEACALARAYLGRALESDLVEVRRDYMFMQKIGKPRLVE